MKNNVTPEQMKADIVKRTLAMLLQRINFSKRNAGKCFELIEKIEGDADLTATEKKALLGKINSYFLLSTDDLLDIAKALSDAKSDTTMSGAVRVMMTEEVEKWAT